MLGLTRKNKLKFLETKLKKQAEIILNQGKIISNQHKTLNPQDDKEELFLFNVRALPRGVIIKRIFTRHSKNNNQWRVSYHQRTTCYWGATLDIALAEFFKNNEDKLLEYNDNNVGSIGVN